jgi:hypothetical protein
MAILRDALPIRRLEKFREVVPQKMPFTHIEYAVVNVSCMFTISAGITIQVVRELVTEMGSEKTTDYTRAIKDAQVLVDINAHQPSRTTFRTEVTLVRIFLAAR